jgi:hypothetical protein
MLRFVLALLALSCLVVAESAHAGDCWRVIATWQTIIVKDAVFLAAPTDLAGQRAAFFALPPAAGSDGRWRVAGPLDLTRASADKRAPQPGALPKLSAGDVGTLRFHRLVERRADDGDVAGDVEGDGAADVGYFAAFARTGASDPARLADIATRVRDPFVVGLHVGAPGPAADAALRQLMAWAQSGKSEDRAALEAALLGAVYATPDARAQTLFTAQLGFLGAHNPRLLTALRDRSLADLAALEETAPDAWLEWLPFLARAWRAKPRQDLTAALNDALLGGAMPDVPYLDGPPMNPWECSPKRHERRGPFQGPGELTDKTLATLLQRKHGAFGVAALKAFARIELATDAFVLDSARDDRGTPWMLAIEPRHPRAHLVALPMLPKGAALPARGQRVSFVGYDAPSALKSPLLTWLDLAQLSLDPIVATRVRAQGVPDNTAFAQSVLPQVRGHGGNGFGSGLGIATLFTLTQGSAPGFSVDALRTQLWSVLPGNTYDKTYEWTNDWGPALSVALSYGADRALGDEIERSLPLIVAAFLRRPHGAKGNELDGTALRRFLVDVSIAIAWQRLRIGDGAGARAILERAGGPLAAFAQPGVTITAEERHATEALRVHQRAMAVLTDSTDSPVPAGAAAPPLGITETAHVRNAIRRFSPALRNAWMDRLVRAGWPRLSD